MRFALWIVKPPLYFFPFYSWVSSFSRFYVFSFVLSYSTQNGANLCMKMSERISCKWWPQLNSFPIQVNSINLYRSRYFRSIRSSWSVLLKSSYSNMSMPTPWKRLWLAGRLSSTSTFPPMKRCRFCKNCQVILSFIQVGLQFLLRKPHRN